MSLILLYCRKYINLTTLLSVYNFILYLLSFVSMSVPSLCLHFMHR